MSVNPVATVVTNENYWSPSNQTWPVNQPYCFDNGTASCYQNDFQFNQNKQNHNDNIKSSSSDSSQNNKHLTNYQTTIFTTQKMNNSTTKLSYTPYQLELLNSIYTDMKYPNSVQKTLVAKLIGITRDQVKIWFQNRRRKDTINSQTGSKQNKGLKRSFSEDDSYSNDETPSTTTKSCSLVGNQIIEGILNELRNHKNAPSRLSSKRAKLTLNNEKLNETQLLTNATQILDSQVLKKTPNNCIIDLCPIINASSTSKDLINNSPHVDYSSTSNSFQTTITTSSCSDQDSETPSLINNNNNYLNIASNYNQNFQLINKPYDIQSYLQKKYYQNYYYQQPQQQQQWPQIVDSTTSYNYTHNSMPSEPSYSNEYFDNYNNNNNKQQDVQYIQQQPLTYTPNQYNNFNNYVNNTYQC